MINLICGVCGTVGDYISQQPTPGMVTFCLFCGASCSYESGVMRELTETEKAALTAAVLQELTRARWAFDAIRKRDENYAAIFAAMERKDDCPCSKCRSRRKRAGAQARAAIHHETARETRGETI